MNGARPRNNNLARNAPPTTTRPRWILVLLCATFFLAVSDSTIVYTALPSIGSDLAMSETLRWVIVAYLLSSGTLLLLGGRAADRLGQRRVFLWGVGLFTAMSLLCGLAWSGGALIAARALQGTGAAMMVPAALSMVMTAFPEGARRNRALGVWGALAGIGATTGLLLGGPITQLLGWRAVFLINVPIGLTVLALGPRILPSDGARPTRRRTLDLPGAVTATIALLLLISATVDAGRTGGARMVGLLTAGALLLALFSRIERRSAHPLIPLRLFRSPTLVAGNLVILAAGVSVDGLLYAFTVLAQQVLGQTAVWFGLAMTVMTVISFVGVCLGQHLVSRLGARPVAAVGFVLIGIGSVMLAHVADRGGLPMLLAGLAMFGSGLGAAFVAGQIAALTGVADEDAGVASGVEETTFAFGNALGVALASTVILAANNLQIGTRAALITTASIAALGLLASLLRLGAGVGADHDRAGEPEGSS